MLYLLVTILCASCSNSGAPAVPESSANLPNAESVTTINASDSVIGPGYSGYSLTEPQAPTIAAAQNEIVVPVQSVSSALQSIATAASEPEPIAAQATAPEPEVSVPAREPAPVANTTPEPQEADLSPDAVMELAELEKELAALEPIEKPVASLSILNQGVNEITANEASIYWQLNTAATGQLAYGTTTALGQWSTAEDSYTYDSHLQKLSSLEPDTLYYYRIHSTDELGSEAISPITEFRTAPLSQAANEVVSEPQTQPEPEPESKQEQDKTNGPVVSADGWPKEANGDLPWSGIFYGNAITAQLATNSVLAVQNSRRFRAQRSGDVVALRFQNRVLFPQNIETRCKRFGSSSIWCRCKNAGLDEYTCGYSLGNSYSVGNGGLIHVEVRPDQDGVPGNKVLARTDAWVPQDYFKKTGNANETFPLTSAATLVAGETYHLVYLNANPPTSCELRNVPASAASSCPRNQGAIGLNGTYDTSYPTRTGRYGPFRGDSSMNLYRSGDSDKWKESTKGLSFFELHYADGMKLGETYHANDGDSVTKTIQGSAKARQAFTVRDASREVNGVWLNFGHATSADGSALTATLRDGNGQALANGTIEASAECRSSSNHRCREWGYADFGKSINLLEDKQYSIEFSAGSKAGFRMLSVQPFIAHGYQDRNYWTDARAEFSTNGGSSWNEWSPQLGKERDLAVLFTIRGMPRQLP